MRLRETLLDSHGSSREVEGILPSTEDVDAEPSEGGDRERGGMTSVLRVVRSWEAVTQVLPRIAGILVGSEYLCAMHVRCGQTKNSSGNAR